MKKLIISIVIIISVLAILPIIGNGFAQNILKTKVEILTSNGVMVRNETTKSSYLKTKKHYEFLLSDASKFINYINRYSQAQIPPYVDAMIDGVVIGVDIEYSNFISASTLLVDIYPLSLPTNMMDELKKEDTDFYAYVKKLLESRGVLYHINYNLSNEFFDGYMKNIDEEYSFNNGTKIIFKVLDLTYDGQGALIAPQKLKTDVSKIVVEVDSSSQKLFFKLRNLSSSSIFESQSTYLSSANIKSFSLLIVETLSGKTEVNIDDIKMNISSNTQGKKAQFYTKSSFQELKLDSKYLNFLATNFNSDISLDDVDKDSYEEFRKLTSYTDVNYSKEFEEDFQEAITKILSKGLTLSVADFSVAKIDLEKQEAIDGFSIMVKLILKKDANLSKSSFIENIDLTSTLKFSKDFYALINSKLPIEVISKEFAREDGDNLVFEIKLDSGKLTINDKEIK